MGAGVGSFAADQHAHPGRPGRCRRPLGRFGADLLAAGLRFLGSFAAPAGGGEAADLDEDVGDLGDLGAVTVPAVGVDRRHPRPLGKQRDRLTDVLGDRIADRVLQRPMVGLVDQVVEEVVGEPGPVGADEDPPGPGVLGSWPRAWSRTAMWSAAVLLPARPVRRIPARASLVLSRKHRIGW